MGSKTPAPLCTAPARACKRGKGCRRSRRAEEQLCVCPWSRQGCPDCGWGRWASREGGSASRWHPGFVRFKFPLKLCCWLAARAWNPGGLTDLSLLGLECLFHLNYWSGRKISFLSNHGAGITAKTTKELTNKTLNLGHWVVRKNWKNISVKLYRGWLCGKQESSIRKQEKIFRYFQRKT